MSAPTAMSEPFAPSGLHKVVAELNAAISDPGWVNGRPATFTHIGLDDAAILLLCIREQQAALEELTQMLEWNRVTHKCTDMERTQIRSARATLAKYALEKP